MTDKKKTEVNLEMCSGFFRIPTDDIIYNITVLATNEPSTTKVVEKIIEVEKIVEVERTSPPPQTPGPPAPTAPPPSAGDDYFERCAKKFQDEISLLAQDSFPDAKNSGSSPLTALCDITDMANDLKNVLRTLKDNISSQPGAEKTKELNITPALERLSEKITQAVNHDPAAPVAPAVQSEKSTSSKTITRYLFNLDTVFQTIYELCTNETVKSHIQNARAKAEEIFDKNIFYDAISPKVSGYQEDDGFLTVPMTDIYTSLGMACNDKSTCNLLAKMDKQQAAIFLDQFLPLEIPDKEEVSMIDESLSLSADNEQDQQSSSADDGLATLLRECQTDLDKLIYQSADLTAPNTNDSGDLVNQIEDAMVIAASIHQEASLLMEKNAADSSQQSNALGLKIKGLEALAKTMLDMKAQTREQSYEESLVAGQNAAQRVADEMSAQIKSQTSPPPAPPSAPPTKPKTPEPGGEASQDDIDRLLAELG